MSRQAEIAKRRMAGETLEAIGRDYGLTRERIRQILAQTGIKGVPYYTTRSVAKMVGVHKDIVRKWAHDNLPLYANRRKWTPEAVEAFITYRKNGRKCAVCGAQLPSSRKFYCSDECYKKNQAKLHKKYRWRYAVKKLKPNFELVCPSCEKVRMVFESQAKRASGYCLACARRRQSETHRVRVVCDWCGNELIRRLAIAKRAKHNFCNLSEAALWKHKNGGFRKVVV